MMYLCGRPRLVSRKESSATMFRNESTAEFLCFLLAAPVIDWNISEMSESCQMASGGHVLSSLLIKNKSEAERCAEHRKTADQFLELG
jgi:hypothetical protein